MHFHLNEVLPITESQGSNMAVSIVLTRQAFLIVDISDDSVEKILSLKDLLVVDNPSESTVFRLHCSYASGQQPSKALSEDLVTLRVRFFSYDFISRILFANSCYFFNYRWIEK